MSNVIRKDSLINKLAYRDYPLIKRLSYLRKLDSDEIALLMKLHNRTRHIGKGKNILRQGNVNQQSLIVRQGWAYRYNSFLNGDQQIINFYLPGDIINPYSSVMPKVNYSVASITPIVVCPFSPEDLTDLIAICPKLKPLFEYIFAWEDAILVEQVCRIGRLNAYQRTADLLLELFQRLKLVGGTEKNSFISSLTQQMMADNLGLSIVHINRTLKKLCEAHLISINEHTISLLDVSQLTQVAEHTDIFQELSIPFSQIKNDSIDKASNAIIKTALSD